MAVVDPGMHREELDRRHAETPKMIDHRGLAQRPERAAQMLGDIRMATGETADMHLVDHRVAQRRAQRPVVAPGEAVIDQAAFRHHACIVAPIHRQIAARPADAIAEMQVADMKRAGELARIRIDQQFVRIEAMAFQRRIRSMHTIAVKQSRIGAGHVAVPDAFGILGQGDAFELASAMLVEETELDALRMRGEQREIRAPRIDLGAKRIRAARLNPCRHLRLIRSWARGRWPTRAGASAARNARGRASSAPAARACLYCRRRCRHSAGRRN